MFYQRLVYILIVVLFVGIGVSTAQEDTTMREFADQNDFYIGAAVYSIHLDTPEHAETLSREFNMLTPENEAKACEVQPELGRFDFRRLDELMAFAEAHDMTVRGHTLVWHQCAPSWLQNADFTREEAIGHLRDHIYTVVGRYRGRIPMWDVVNEAIPDRGRGLRVTPWQQLIGDDYVELAFQFAHEADPDALLFYNDYGAEGMNRKSDAVYALAQDFVERGVPIHGVGLQAHMTLGRVNGEEIAQNIQRLGELGLQVQITEMDVKFPGDPTEDILERQAEDYRQVFEACLNSEYCNTFVVWGVSDRFSWLRHPQFYDNPNVAPLLFNDEYEPKPAYFAVRDLLASHAGG